MEDAAQASLSSPSGSTTTTSAPPSSLSSSSSSLPSVGALGAAAGGATVDAVIQQWKAFNLNGSREQLDKQAAEVVHNQDTSLESRKKLAEATRKFRQLPPETKLKSFGSLLKSYQEEVDRLTQRGSFAEKVFLTLYRSLAEIADPVQALQSALNDTKHAEKLAEQEQENKRLQRQLQEFRKEFQEVQNQEVTIRNLEEKLRNYETKVSFSSSFLYALFFVLNDDIYNVIHLATKDGRAGGKQVTQRHLSSTRGTSRRIGIYERKVTHN
ncbi:hypothetical protein QOT17_018127 [Balamuthia mandrillaris]